MKTKNLLLLLIVLLALVIRLYRLDGIPAILNRDEAALAYNSYLLLETGKDEWQQSWPLTFKSFGDYKLPGYHYLLVLFFKIFTISDFTVRLPSALAGVFLVFLAFHFAKNILGVSKKSALFLAFLITITPVFFFYSRIAFEANVALLFFVLGIYFLLSKQNKPILASLSFLIAILTYNTPLLLLPLIFPILIFNSGYKNVRKWFWPVLFILVIFAFGAASFMSLTSQKSAITIFSDPSTWEAFSSYRNDFNGIWQSIFGNKYLYYLKLIFANFRESFSLSFLVLSGGSHPWHNLTNFGHLFYFVYFLAVFMIIDFLGEIVVSFFDPAYKFIKKHLIWLYLTIVSLAPSVVTVDSPHATRSLFFFFMLLCMATLFFDKLIKLFPKHAKLFTVIIVISILTESYFYFRSYFLEYEKNQPVSLFVEFPKMLEESRVNYADLPTAVVDGGGFQYILTAWYLRVPATDFFSTMKYQGADNINFYYGERLLNYHFIKEIDDRDPQEKIMISKELGLITYE